MNQRNLMPPARVAAKRRRRTVQRWVAIDAAFFVVLCVIGLAVFFGHSGVQSATASAPTPVEMNKMNVAFATLRQQSTQLKANLHAMTELSGRPDWSVLLSALSQATGDEVVLDGVDCRVTAPAAGETADAAKQQVRLTGIGRTQGAVTQFTLRVEDLHFFGSVQLAQTSSKTLFGSECVGFRLVCTLPDSAGVTP